MTRKKEIVDAAKKAAEEVYSYTFQGMDDLIGLFKAGAEWADAHPVHYDGQAMLYVLQKGKEFGKEEMLKKASNWLSLNLQMLLNVFDVEYNTNDTKTKDFIDDFKKAMEDAR